MMYLEGIRSTSSIDQVPGVGHRQRLRLRVEMEGWDSLKPHEMVELVLCHAVPRQDVSPVARALVERFGSVGGVFAAPEAALLRVRGVSPAMARWLKLTQEALDAYCELDKVRDIPLTCYRDVVRFLNTRYGELRLGDTWLLCADFEFNLMAFKRMESDADWWEAETVRGVVGESLILGARYAYLVHCVKNAESAARRLDVARLNAILATMTAADVSLVDFILAGEDGFTSLKLEGKLEGAALGRDGEGLREYGGLGEEKE